MGMGALSVDEKAQKVLRVIRTKIRPYTDTDICVAAQLSKRVVRKRLRVLRERGLIDEVWKGERSFWEATP
jgi:transcription initiation factor IIE alpha subunit